MVVLNKIYTRTGDKGDTALGNGDRVAKHSARVNAYGTSDELNAFVGVARLEAKDEMDAALARIQNDLFDLGADLCRPEMDKDADADYPPLRIADAQVSRLETEIDAMNAELSPLRSFVLPGGAALSAHLHVCRTVARRAERLATDLATQEDINPAAVTYLNRLSDWFFVASRAANDNGARDVLWVPGANR
ncbi:cob(I)yrinic acid a,c-diamide adenosyltransferase [Phaeobacter gallaeciensis]|uniref:Corrinoid adenosyltransferase n=1 Tax=Phaeobacter gallaeciensis TaxID=60890 RepID=A0AAC9Z694_9RHOB|nr:cob(I)yrinic acid a,c-diamide adenosyltransferase [Phaeobacter gallaeciensis]AHD08060.1 ATP:cob(I)alamin adenosyltransferase [Phaeobacter gallaeciensis DSM 26640]ATE91326.1 putative cobalamin adenosyltransferase [Phaeobacter gallaeciensis]ATE95602.1 putative cobalamin adenosyltransferase [Phaeobacter gallaeciensis]ATE99941.1 putative cobalamin adenosyltransferase [Phaeobacter gallaeciensis]ATF04374.1 putative cobalamin adenosyltransferase [Phaeobacter gallaeciensis]